MTMRSYDDVDFRPWYLPDTARWLKLSLGARGLVAELVRKLDRHGRIALGDDPAADLAVILRLDEPDTRRALDELLAAARVVWDSDARVLFDPDLPARLRQGSAARMATKRAKAKATEPVEPVVDALPPDSVTPVTSRHTRHIPSPSDLICSDLISDLGSRSEEPTGNRVREVVVEPILDVPDALATAPPWWVATCETVSASTLGRSDALAPPECWMAYAGHRAGKRRQASRQDAVYWLTTVMVPKAREDLRRAARDRERDHTFAAERAAKVPGNGSKPEGWAPAKERELCSTEAQRETQRLAAAAGLAFLDAANDRTGTDE